MAAPQSVAELLALMRKSTLVEPGRLATFIRQHQPALAAPADSLAPALLAAGLLTQYQLEQLAQGKYHGFFLGKYVVLERLGRGGMATVLLCEHIRMRRRVALKVLPPASAAQPALLERFFREAKAAAALDHPNIVRAHDVDHANGLYFLVMEYVDGTNLQDVVTAHGPLAPGRVAHYLRQAALGLDHAHRQGVVHRDVKPANLLLDRTGTVKVLDMGLARFFHDEEDGLTRDHHAGQVLGTADYLAPEQAMDSHAVDHRADLYSLGMTGYFLLTGKVPFPDSSMALKLLAHQQRDPAPLRQVRPEVPEGLAAVLAKMHARELGARYLSAAEAAAALAAWAPADLPPPPAHEMPQLCPAAAGGMAAHLGEAPPTAVPTPRPTPRGVPAPTHVPRARPRPASGRLPPAAKAPEPEPPAPPARRRRWVLPAAGGALLAAGLIVWMVWPGTPRPKATVILDTLTPPPVRGPFVPLPLAGVATFPSTRRMFNDTDDQERLIFPDWKPKTFAGVPFDLVDPEGEQRNNVILLHGPQGKIPPTMPRAVKLPVNQPVQAIHLLSGVSGWGFPTTPQQTITLTVRFHFAGGLPEDHQLRNAVHFADFIKKIEVNGSKYAFDLRGQQIRYLLIRTERPEVLKDVEFLKGNDPTAPVIMAVTAELPPAPAPGS